VLTLPPSVRIYLSVEPVDLRRGHDGLSGIVRGQWEMDLFAGHLFVFLGRRGDRCKILFWDRQGMCLYAKKLDRGRFIWPQAKDGVVKLTMAQLSMLLESIDWRATAWTARPEVVV